jgi:hypothetical protein
MIRVMFDEGSREITSPERIEGGGECVFSKSNLQLETTRLQVTLGEVMTYIGEFSVGLRTAERDETVLVIRVEKISARTQPGLGMDYKRL